MEEASGVVMVWVVLFVVTRFLEFWFLRGFLRYVVSFQWLGRCCVKGRMSREWRRQVWLLWRCEMRRVGVHVEW
jgi:hypothetical protein